MTERKVDIRLELLSRKKASQLQIENKKEQRTLQLKTAEGDYLGRIVISGALANGDI